MTFEARYYGRCPACDEPIHPGQDVAYVAAGDLVHDACTDDRDNEPVKLSEIACPRCWLIHAEECM